MTTVCRVSNIKYNMTKYKPEETGIIILGDAGLNYYLNNTDKKYKTGLNNIGYHIYCVRGNHEERPENIATYNHVYDDNVRGWVWMEEAFPNLKFFDDGGTYTLGDKKVLTIGGAYSIDKWYRLIRAGYSADEAEIADPKRCGWFKGEQLSVEERNSILNEYQGIEFDLILSHTCPLSWAPTDLFLRGIDQSTVDKSMEIWLDQVKDLIGWKLWLFGHYHADRIERPYVEQFYLEYEDLNTIWERWQKYNETKTLDWWIPKSPAMEDILNGETA